VEVVVDMEAVKEIGLKREPKLGGEKKLGLELQWVMR
jgi:hypothetical protein